MSPAADFNRTITDLDHVRIFNLLRRQAAAGAASDHASVLAEVIDAADQVRPQEIAGDVVTMYSKLRVADPAGGDERSVTLVYPPDADAAQGMISVLSPLGTALLGVRVGEVAHWQGADGKPGALTVLAIEFQPEASGDYTA
ncbi:nucleoside diphosphate kinase regulator [Ottowia sp.]|uniref:nucleoside diphosphate kinase regulator n=1 Tax=Ottowia sp. TaxID=1898956 RepID=UPI002C9988B4|nr:nucleoside diphosphate kinase regulator [Ottowia sp.]HOB65925.1 nucleoside diphosphate kinase regulator [Ottowia sp.]HPZ58036.1 nucleoside diphosphate kinase regulator [Ottowia sp.]HQD48688.1 nucleoside diphosphate kinase regulator [Ottowia sp.]